MSAGNSWPPSAPLKSKGDSKLMPFARIETFSIFGLTEHTIQALRGIKNELRRFAFRRYLFRLDVDVPRVHVCVYE